MNTYLQLILPSLVLPLMLSAIWLAISRRYRTLLRVMPLIWLPSCFWLAGWPKLLPQEAIDWLWLLVILSMGVQIGLSQRLRLAVLVQAGLLGLTLIILTWPVLKYQPSIGLAMELVAVLLAGSVLFFSARANRATTPSLALALSSGGLALVTALGGSVLVGQLAGALASVLGAFALYELYKRFTAKAVSNLQLTPMIQVYLALLLIARVYADIPLGSAVLLLMAPLVGLLSGARYAAIGSVVSVIAALTWLLLTADASSYY